MFEFSPVVMTVIVSVVAVGLALIALARSGTPVTVEGVFDTLEASYGEAQELTEVALTGARAAEQLYRSGKITRDERLGKAVEYVERWFPDLDEDSIITAVESAVLVVNTLVGRKVQ